ncbi:MAG: NCS2 family permease [Candidatus Obscuribacterales bacterium]|nr:NCS2 family permease [Candidatus Obscuribacterales bacterium]
MLFLDRFFKITERGSTIKTELIGGATTFVTMAYIIVVNPAILSFAGFPLEPMTIATILTAVFGCLAMALYANLPLAVAPYMGENAFIAFGLAALGITWQQRLGAVFVSGLLFALLAILHIRPWLANSISFSLKQSFAAGIGLFLTFIGLYQTGIIRSGAQGMKPEALTLPSGLLRSPDVPVTLGNFHDPQVMPQVLLTIFGFVLIASLMQRKVTGAILIGMVVTGGIGICLGLGQPPTKVFDLPFQGAYTLAPLALQMDVVGVLKLSFLPILLTLFLMSFLDTLGTLVGVGSAGDMLDKDGNFPEVEKPMMVDAVTCTFSAMIGSSTAGAFIESAAGVKEGARTGLAALIVGLLFTLSLFFIPLVEPFQHLRFAYAPALIAVGLLMIGSMRKIDLDDLTEAVPAFATIVMMIFSYNIANGLTAGLILHPLMKLLAGRAAEIHPGSYVLASLCLIYYCFGLPH